MWTNTYLTVLDLKVVFFCISVNEKREPLIFEMEKSNKIKKNAAMLESSTTEIIKKPTKTIKKTPKYSLLCLVTYLKQIWNNGKVTLKV